VLPCTPLSTSIWGIRKTVAVALNKARPSGADIVGSAKGLPGVTGLAVAYCTRALAHSGSDQDPDDFRGGYHGEVLRT